MIDPIVIGKAVLWLNREGETVTPAGMGLWLVNGVPQTAEEVVGYANDLRRIFNFPPLPTTPGRPKGRRS